MGPLKQAPPRGRAQQTHPRGTLMGPLKQAPPGGGDAYDSRAKRLFGEPEGLSHAYDLPQAGTAWDPSPTRTPDPYAPFSGLPGGGTSSVGEALWQCRARGESRTRT